MKQESFSTLWDGYETNSDAIKARNARAKELKLQGHRAFKWTLRNQLRQYAGLGQPDGRVGNVYMISVD